MIREWLRRRRERTEAKVAAVFLAKPDDAHFGYPLSRASGVRPAPMFDALDRFLDRGWIVDGWSESANPRRFYVLTDKGRTEMPR